MDQAAKKSKSLFREPIGINDTSGEVANLYGNKKEATLGNRGTNFFLTDEDLERIKERIRKKDRTDTKRLLILYGALLIVVLWFLSSYGIF